MNVTTARIEACEPGDLAAWIGLADASLLGSEPVHLPAEIVERLKLYRERTELGTQAVALILRLPSKEVVRLAREGRRLRGAKSPIVLGHRKTTGGKLAITGGDLSDFIAAAATPPVPTTGIKRSRADKAAARKATCDTRARHNL